MGRHEFMQGLKECRMYNQGILSKIFDSLDKGSKGYLRWDEFLGGMKIVCSQSDADKVDLFLQMVDSGGDEDDDDDGEGGNGCFDFDEIREICELTFQDFNANKKKEDSSSSEESDGEEKEDILKETAEFQAQNIFRLLGYDIDDEIPMEVFKHAIFNGDEDTRIALRQFCCLD